MADPKFERSLKHYGPKRSGQPLTLGGANTPINAGTDQKFPYGGTAKQPAIKSIVVTIPGKTFTLVEDRDLYGRDYS